MTLGIAVGAYLVVHLLGAYLLRASGVAGDLFGRFRDVGDMPEPRPLDEMEEFIENHPFWEIKDTPDSDDEEADVAVLFWGERASKAS